MEAGEDPDAGDADPYRAALHSPIVGSIKGTDSLGPEEADLHKASLRRSWTPYLDPELKELLILQKLVLLQFVLQHQRDPSMLLEQPG